MCKVNQFETEPSLIEEHQILLLIIIAPSGNAETSGFRSFLPFFVRVVFIYLYHMVYSVLLQIELKLNMKLKSKYKFLYLCCRSYDIYAMTK